MPPPAHLHLRQATAQAHRLAEDTPVMRQLLDGTLDRRSYAALLRGQHALHAAWEAAHADWLASVAREWSYLPRAPRLAADLAALGDGAAEDESPRAPTTSLSRIARGGFASWGALYVIEGAALGGQVLLRRLVARWPDLPHHFFRVGEARPRAAWRQLQTMLDRHLTTIDQQQRAIDGARAMFADVQRMLEAVAR